MSGVFFGAGGVNSYQNSYSQAYYGGNSAKGGAYSSAGNIASDLSEETSDKISKRREIAEQLRGLYSTQKNNENPYAVSTDSLVNSLWETSDTSDKNKKDLLTADTSYNFREVSSKVQRAKTSLSAGQAVMAAKRKVLELKRKMASAGEDSEEIQIALNHAKRIELVAKKKKRHLELEEMVNNTQKRDEEMDKTEEAAKDMKNTLIDITEDKISDRQSELIDEQTQMLAEATEELKEQGEEITDEMLKELDRLIEDFGDEEAEMLEEMSEMLESMEIIDPHMSEEDLKELKTKHRNSENKDIVKADMDYLKDIIKNMEKSGGGIPGMSRAGASVGAAFSASVGGGMPSVSVSAPSVDIQV